MYAQQSRTGVPELDAVLATAQMVTPEQTPTVAAQVAQAAAQKLAPRMAPPPGIGALMPGVRQQAVNAAQAMQPVTQGQMQQMMQQNQMAQQSPGVAGLPAPNMQGMAEGGVVGYAGPDRSFVEGPRRVDVSGDIPIYAPREKEPGETEAEYRARKAKEAEEAQGQKPIPRALSWFEENVLRPLSQMGSLRTAEMRGAPAAQQAASTAPSPAGILALRGKTGEPERDIGQMAPPAVSSSRAVAAPRPAAPPSAAAAPQAGIAQLVAPTPEGAMASARSTLGLPGTEGLRSKEEAYLAALKAQPATGQQGLAALQEQQAGLKAMYDKAEKESNINSVIQQLLGRGEGPGGAARASMAFSEREDARRRAYYDLQLANATKRDAIIDLQNARDVGNAKAALEAEHRVRAADLAVAKAEGDLAAHFATSQASVYGTQVRSQDEAANRATQLQIARIQAAARNDPQSKEALAVARVQQAVNGSRMLQELAKAAAMGFPGAQEKYDAEEAKLYQRLAPELLQGAGAAPALAPPPAGAVRVKGGG